MRKIRYFMGFFQAQEKWLNEMVKKGWRLVGTSTLVYEFKQCEPNEFEYRVEFVGKKSYKQLQDYMAFLQEAGYVVFTKNLNLNFAFGKFRWRPYAKGQIATSPGGYNKEILIIEKDNRRLESYTQANGM